MLESSVLDFHFPPALRLGEMSNSSPHSAVVCVSTEKA